MNDIYLWQRENFDLLERVESTRDISIKILESFYFCFCLLFLCFYWVWGPCIIIIIFSFKYFLFSHCSLYKDVAQKTMASLLWEWKRLLCECIIFNGSHIKALRFSFFFLFIYLLMHVDGGNRTFNNFNGIGHLFNLYNYRCEKAEIHKYIPPIIIIWINRMLNVTCLISYHNNLIK